MPVLTLCLFYAMINMKNIVNFIMNDEIGNEDIYGYRIYYQRFGFGCS